LKISIRRRKSENFFPQQDWISALFVGVAKVFLFDEHQLMKIIDNSSSILGDELKASLGRGSRLKIAASCFSIYAFEALKSDLGKIEAMRNTDCILAKNLN
jgi:hypothetical protein